MGVHGVSMADSPIGVRLAMSVGASRVLKHVMPQLRWIASASGSRSASGAECVSWSRPGSSGGLGGTWCVGKRAVSKTISEMAP